jgi:coenzyme F420-0:L-glutamate ligase/coenzyme F420-1:gamma-L-glutamate ligase
MQDTIQIIPIKYIKEVLPRDDLSRIIAESLQKQGLSFENNDILIITQKIVSKAEGKIIDLSTVTPSLFAKQIARNYKKDPRHIEVILQETKRIVRMDHGVIIAETHHGFICANAGVDESNIGNNHTVSMLPKDPDASADHLRRNLQKITKKQLAVIISDTWGRPWREGQVNFAIGSSGLKVLKDYRGEKDPYGYDLQVSQIAIADELAAAAELVMGKIEAVPVAIIRGYSFDPSSANAQELIRDAKTDMFR